MSDVLSTYLARNKDILLLKSKNNTVIAGPEYCYFKRLLKEELIKYYQLIFPEILFVELSLPGVVSTTDLESFGYTKDFQIVSLEAPGKSLKPELFAGSYNELSSLKHYFGEKVCYYSIGSSFRNEKSTKQRVIRSFEFEQLELQFCVNVNFSAVFNGFFDFLSTFSHNSLRLVKEIKKDSELPFYSEATHDINYTSKDGVTTLELGGISKRRGNITELSLGVSRVFITSMIDSDINPTIASTKLKILNTKFTRKLK